MFSPYDCYQPKTFRALISRRGLQKLNWTHLQLKLPKFRRSRQQRQLPMLLQQHQHQPKRWAPAPRCPWAKQKWLRCPCSFRQRPFKIFGFWWGVLCKVWIFKASRFSCLEFIYKHPKWWKNHWNFQTLSDDFLWKYHLIHLSAWLVGQGAGELWSWSRRRGKGYTIRWRGGCQQNLWVIWSQSLICGKAIINQQCDAKCCGEQLLVRCNDKSKSQVPRADKGVADAPIDVSEEEEENALEDDMVDAEKAQQLRVEGNEHFKAWWNMMKSHETLGYMQPWFQPHETHLKSAR